ncbi:hypothetical protein NHQ30_000896 [Ciborinia camelliae]|nr:hypothetical protein NHQ30_000896 [Ciborinia camelliae]
MGYSRRHDGRSSIVEENIHTYPAQTPHLNKRQLAVGDVTLGSIAMLSPLPVGKKAPKIHCLKTGKQMNARAFNHPVAILAISKYDGKEVSALCCTISGNSNPITSEAPSFLPISPITLNEDYDCVPDIRNEAVLENKAMLKRCYILTGHGLHKWAYRQEFIRTPDLIADDSKRDEILTVDITKCLPKKF